ncbi:hypothetical protein EMIHUDRAFT_222411 [Emiliania huxleyi CCMP1516]|uniref:AB hydrolase-1 domain-containing protein n=2 Tax=Emiliania huxleyi TaxID=2903 RepID=A0A0D3KY46_EMIH1|nr:hypothetical protein EMIHUDRAFT_249970 [Emiliania huxleyi CCMP1516]XP_005793110.1 hypothetical protein EMIHUDRAFT_222411 [Emiliania huxleyi CCMP1516]EOD06252.1 hypothetical protein EMIHUDRAFT_249970 [Emiliania huxleyi CCMP1516]EOD40681.1 hypothetical protein EMIHUDRAFT_222411 [Emiliania huxleyi CCMP1516]|eukprot:XP_005758681.1 hypothetical protein EMIHUDRAFT_249970 [Emiliania huxleyi CCMP1516]
MVGVHAESNELVQKVLSSVPELASWPAWYRHPRALSNGHVHTILAAKARRTRAVKYHRLLVPTPDGGTLAVDLLCGIRRARARDPQVGALGSLLSGGAVAGAAEDTSRTDTLFVDAPPPLEQNRPLLLLASGLGGGSQDTYVRSMAATAAERGWQVAVVNMRACGGSPVTSPRLFSAYRGANDDVRLAAPDRTGASPPQEQSLVSHQATTHAGDASHAIGAACSLATPLDMPANSANLQRPFHKAVYDRNLGRSLQALWGAARDQFVDASGAPLRVPYWDGLSRPDKLDPTGGDKADGAFLADDALASSALSIRELDEALTRRQYGYESVDDYYAAASSDQRLPLIDAPLLLLNAFDDPIVPGLSLLSAIERSRANPSCLFAVTSHGGHLGWADRDDSFPWGGSGWVERASLGFLEAALGIAPASECETVACEVFD